METLDHTRRSDAVRGIAEALAQRIRGQPRSVECMVDVLQSSQASIMATQRPLASLLFLGPTGVGKSLTAEVAAELVSKTVGGLSYGPSLLKINCGEYVHGHEVSRLVGAPPGYVGYREANTTFSQSSIKTITTNPWGLGFVLFDEIDKAHYDLWTIMLNLLDKAEVVLGTGEKVDFSRCVICMTSNDGAREIERMVSGKSIGLRPTHDVSTNAAGTDQEIYRIAVQAARRRLPPEFFNRIDKVVVFRPLSKSDLYAVLEVELGQLQEKLYGLTNPFLLTCTDAMREHLVEEGYDPRYGARHLKRSVRRFLERPLNALVATGQIKGADRLLADYDVKKGCPVFSRADLLGQIWSKSG